MIWLADIYERQTKANKSFVDNSAWSVTRESVDKALINWFYRLIADNLESVAIRLGAGRLGKLLSLWRRWLFKNLVIV